MTRQLWVFIHRWAGIAMAAFLIVVGLTGSLLAFYPELERLVNPHWYPDRAPQQWLDAGTLAAQLEAAEPRLRVGQISLHGFDGATSAWVAPRIDSVTGKPYDLDYDYVVLDPETGDVLDRVRWGAISEGVGQIMSFIYDLHWTLAMGEIGMWVLGIVALVWTLDCFVGLYLTFPVGRPSTLKPDVTARYNWWRRWKPAWTIRWRASKYKVNFDLHRAGGLWLWIMLLVFAWSGVYMNMWDTVYTWTTRAVLDFRPQWTELEPLPKPLESPRLDWIAAQSVGEKLISEQAVRHGFVVKRQVAMRLYQDIGVYQYQVESNREIDERPRRYTTQVFFDANTGSLKLALFPSGQYAGNTLSNWLYALHMGNVFGLPYRIFVSVLGILIVMLSVTGIVIWLKKRHARRFIEKRLTGTSG